MLDTPLQSLDSVYTGEYPVDEYMQNMDMITEALQTIGGMKAPESGLPDYYDDLLMRLIDSIPLE